MIIGEDQNGLVKIWINRPCDGYYLRWWYNGWHYWWFLPGTISFDTEGENYYTLGTQKIAMGSGQINYSQCQAIRTILNAIDIYIWTDVGWKSTRLERVSVIVYDNKVNGYEIEFVMIMGSRRISDSGYSPIIIIPGLPPMPYVPACGTVTIGTQTWFACNYDINYPGSKVYNDNEANRALYGGLYSWNHVNSPGFMPFGWHLPSIAEWTVLINYVGTLLTAGGKLKEIGTTRWSAPNTGATDDFGFTAVGNGFYYLSTFWELGQSANFWASDGVVKISYTSAGITVTPFVFIIPTAIYGVRLISDTVVITKYGLLYNWHAYNTGLLAPTGCHVPTRAEWVTLDTTLGGSWQAGGFLKERGTVNWLTPNTDATNDYNFTALPAGLRDGYNGAFQWRGERTEFIGSGAWPGSLNYELEYNFPFSQSMWWANQNEYERNGYSVRCFLDGVDPANPGTVTDIDGNVYRTIKIGTQVIMASNLKVTRYNDGSAIPEVTSNAAWIALNTGARCWYNNIPE